MIKINKMLENVNFCFLVCVNTYFKEKEMMNKKILLAIFIGFAALVSCNGLPKMGNGNLVTSEKTVSTFEKITISGSAKVRYHVSEEYRAVVTVDSNLEEYTRVFTRDDVLNIGTARGSYWFTKYVVDVYSPTLASVSVSGSAQFSSGDAFNASTFDANISGSGKIEGTIECDALSAKISGSGRMIVGGNCKDFRIEIAGSGNFNGDDFTANNADVRISGSGRVNIGVTDNLKAKISGSGNLYYRGEPPVLEANVSGSGRVKKL